MMNDSRDIVWPRSASLTVKCIGGRQLGRCYNESTYEIRADRELNRSTIDALYAAGLLGYGQGFHVQPVRVEVEQVAPVVMCGGRVVADEEPINRWTGKPYDPTERKVHVYTCVSTCDSSD